MVLQEDGVVREPDRDPGSRDRLRGVWRGSREAGPEPEEECRRAAGSAVEAAFRLGVEGRKGAPAPGEGVRTVPACGDGGRLARCKLGKHAAARCCRCLLLTRGNLGLSSCTRLRMCGRSANRDSLLRVCLAPPRRTKRDDMGMSRGILHSS